MARGKTAMKTQDIIKYALMAAAAWLAYTWLRDQGYLAELGIGTAPGQIPAGSGAGGGTGAGAGTGAGSGAGAGAGAGSGSGSGGGNSTGTGAGSNQGDNTSAGGSTSTGSLKEQLRIAAQSAASSNAGMLHFWQWNYYLPSNVARPDPFAVGGWPSVRPAGAPQSAEDVETTPLTLDQYWTLVSPVLAPGGVSGVGGHGLRGVNHWGQQPSQWYGQAPNQQGTGMGRTMRRGRGDLGGGGF